MDRPTPVAGAAFLPREARGTGKLVAMWLLRSTEPAFTFRLLPGDIRTMGRAAGAQFVVDAPWCARPLPAHPRARGHAGRGGPGSTNGTFVNDRKVEGATPLGPDDRLVVGGVHFHVSRA